MKSVKVFGLMTVVPALMLAGVVGAAEETDTPAKDPIVAACEKEASDAGIADKDDMKTYVADCIAAMKAEQQGGDK
jgi:hypothetical protein